METLKIAMLAPEFLPNWGGAGTYSILLARELSRFDEIHVFTTIRGGDNHLNLKDIEAYFENRVKIHIVSKARETFFYNAIFQFNVARNLPRIIRRERYDIIHSNHAHMPDIGLKLRNLEGTSITTVHTTLSSQFKGIKQSSSSITHMDNSEKMVRFGYPVLRILEKYYLNRSDHMIFVSGFIQDEVKRIVKKPIASTRIVRNGVDLEHFQYSENDPQRQSRVNIMFCGRLLALKGLNHLMGAFSAVHKFNPRTHLTLVGGGDLDQWKETARSSGIPGDAITFTGQKKYEEMPSIIEEADIFVLPSMSESMPLSLLEAMACGKASVASRVGGIPEIISNGENGFLVKPGDQKELTESLNAMVHDPGLRAKLGKNAREHIVKEFNLVDMVKETREMFCKVLNGDM
jgi:glycosyltransferase involved in cell wall biosynthesis